MWQAWRTEAVASTGARDERVVFGRVSRSRTRKILPRRRLEGLAAAGIEISVRLVDEAVEFPGSAIGSNLLVPGVGLEVGKLIRQLRDLGGGELRYCVFDFLYAHIGILPKNRAI